MLPFETPTIFEQLPRFIFQMPKVVQNQKNKFENDELFRKLSRESEIRYTGFRDRPIEERQIRFINGCREGHTDIAFVSTGTNLQLLFNPLVNIYHHPHHPHHPHHHPHPHHPHHHHHPPQAHPPHHPNHQSTPTTDYCDFDKEKGKVHIRSSMIIDGVCIRWRGYIDLERLDGVGCLEYDEERGRIEDAILRQQIEQYKLRMKEFEERQKLYKLNEPQAQPAKKTVAPAVTTAISSSTTSTTTATTPAAAAAASSKSNNSSTSSSNLSKGELRKYHIENILSGSLSNHSQQQQQQQQAQHRMNNLLNPFDKHLLSGSISGHPHHHRHPAIVKKH